MSSQEAALDAEEFLALASRIPVRAEVEAFPLAEANEVRVVFSEPMVTLGKIPQPVVAPFFRIEPAVKGTFRWSGTTTLIFTPEPLPFDPPHLLCIGRLVPWKGFDLALAAHSRLVERDAEPNDRHLGAGGLTWHAVRGR